MKPSKKQIPIKNIVNENAKSSAGSASGIKTYFKTAQKSFVVDQTAPEAKTNNDAKQFYVDILKEKLRRVHNEGDNMAEVDAVESIYDEEQVDEPASNNVAQSEEEVPSVESGVHTVQDKVQCTGCAEKLLEIDEWQNKYNSEVAQRKELKKLYVNSTVSFSELYAKYNDLVKTTAALPESVDDETTTSSCDDIFTPNELKFLRCMPLEKDHDCSFILTALKFVYKADLSIFASRTLKGTAERIEITSKGQQVHHPAKDPMTPQKVRRMQTLFIERISKCEISSTDYQERMKESYGNKLFAAGIRNISKKKI